MGSTKETFVVYASQLSAMLELPDTELRGILSAILEYHQSKTEPKFNGALLAFWKTIKDGLDRNAEKWELIREKRIEAGRKGGKQKQANACFDRQNQANQAVNVPVPVNVPVIEEKIKKEPSFSLHSLDEENARKTKRANFQKPTIEEVKEYCEEKKSPIDPEAFWNFYESKGWKVGQAPMKNWRSAVVTWEKTEQQRKTQNGGIYAAGKHLSSNPADFTRNDPV